MSRDPELAQLRHDLRTPLNHIVGYAEMLLEDVGPERHVLATDLHRVVDGARAVLAIVNTRLTSEAQDARTTDLQALGAAMKEPVTRIAATIQALERNARALGAPNMLADLARIADAAQHLLKLGASWDAGRESAAEAEATHAPVSRQTRGVVLVVDDDEGNRDLLSRRLVREGYTVRTASDGRAALEILGAGLAPPIDLVLLDVMMPDIDGYEVLARLKQDEALRSLAVLMISALDDLKSIVRCIELGAEDYLAKPFDPVLLRARIGACLEKKRLRDQESRHVRELAEWNRTLEQRVADQVAQVERLGRLKRFFSPQLAELIVAGGAADPLKSHRAEITVVFLDLRGFTAFAETADPEEVMGVLRDYHAEMGRLVLAHEGTLERFTGDGMMIFFNDPVPVSDAPARAIRMAIAMRDRVTELSAQWRRLDYELGFGVGIAQGYATIGAIGFEGRWDYGAVGSVTNLAARLCSEARPGQILIPQRLRSQVEGLVDVEAVGELSLKGFHRPISAFNVLRLRRSGEALHR